jgi:hypothetical protein
MTDLSAGAQLRQRIDTQLADDGLELDGKEQEILDRAVAVADTIKSLEQALVGQEPVVISRRGAPTINPILTELRLQRLVLLRLLGALDLNPNAKLSASARGRRAANARWNNVRRSDG